MYSRIEVPNGQILKNQYNNLPEYKCQPDITLADTIIHLLGKDLIGFKPYYFQKKVTNHLPKTHLGKHYINI